jgi:hypothetical protein
LPNQTEILLKDIPYYQVIQQSSTNWNVFPKSIDDGSNLATSHYNSQNESNIGYDQSTDRFTWFAMGLNYLFYTDNMESDGDNILFYNPEQLEQLNSNFINNPS